MQTSDTQPRSAVRFCFTITELKYQTVNDAVRHLGTAQDIRDLFIGFKKYLYGRKDNKA